MEVRELSTELAGDELFGLPLPAYAHPGDAGADLRAAADVVLPPGGRATVGTGIAIAVPEGYAAFVHPRSGLAASGSPSRRSRRASSSRAATNSSGASPNSSSPACAPASRLTSLFPFQLAACRAAWVE